MPECIFTDDGKKDEISRLIKNELSIVMDDYFKNAPFLVSAEQHYKDHLWVRGLMEDVATVKKSFLQRIGLLVAVFIAGGFSLTAFIKYFGR